MVVGIWLFFSRIFAECLAVEISLYQGKEGSSTCLVLVFYAQQSFFVVGRRSGDVRSFVRSSVGPSIGRPFGGRSSVVAFVCVCVLYFFFLFPCVCPRDMF